MECYRVKIGEGKMHEDELPKNLSQILYDWWYELSEIPDNVGCRVGPIIIKER